LVKMDDAQKNHDSAESQSCSNTSNLAKLAIQFAKTSFVFKKCGSKF
jgi:hypothetical protein